ncbi:MAG: hypothetical protein H6648_07715 [Caldilineae bacterium]|nr:hypothetical protein [Caldilineae bacterium]
MLSLITLLGAGLHNVANGFADVKLGSSPWIHWSAAVAIELGVVAIGLTVAVRAKSGHRNLRLYTGVLLFVAASVFANYDASLESLAGGAITWDRIQTLDRWTLTKAALLGGAIPLMVLLVIESLRELAGESVEEETSVKRGSKPSQPPSERVPATAASVASSRSNGHVASENQDPSGSKDDMIEMITTEPEIAATELAKRLNVGRATVYRWRDEIGAIRVDGKWELI